jgi:hypothetical protein
MRARYDMIAVPGKTLKMRRIFTVVHPGISFVKIR